MAKERVHQLAKRFNMSTKAMMGILGELGYPVKSNMSGVSEEMAAAVEARFSDGKAKVKPEEKPKPDRATDEKVDAKPRKKATVKKKPPEKKEKAKKAKTPVSAKVPVEKKRRPAVKESIKKPVTKKEEAKIKPAATTIAKPALRKRRRRPALTKASPVTKTETQTITHPKTEPLATVRGVPVPDVRGLDRRRRRGRRRKKTPVKVDAQEVKSTVRATLAKIEGGTQRKKYRREKHEEAEPGVERKVVRVAEFLSVAELAEQLSMRPVELIAGCMKLGLMVTINQRLDMETIEMVAAEYEYDVERADEFEVPVEEEIEQLPEDKKPRHAVVTVMGHVDHGKTSLLDYTRRTNVVAGESGGITQHIGAYEITHDGKKLTFIDTPGHEAFTAMRARGAQVTDIVVLIVAADSGVMPQTIEAIDHARAAGVPIIVAINKVDLPAAQPDNVKQQLTAYNLVAEDWGGKTVTVNISAKTGEGVEALLEMILLQAELMDLGADPNVRARGVIVEAQLDRGRGPVATVLVQSGTLRVGDSFVTGTYHGRVRAMFDERGRSVEEAGPSTPVLVLGASGVPQAGDSFQAVASESEARDVATRRQRIRREQEVRIARRVRLDDVYDQIQEGAVRELRLVVKGDVDGSVEAVADALERLSTGEVRVNVISKGVGAITESDVLLAVASEAVIIGFHVRPDFRAREVAAREKVDVRFYKVIYEAVDAVKLALEGLLEPEENEEVRGHAQVRQTFRVPKVGVIAGCYITDGKVGRNMQIRVLRDNVQVYDGTVGSLRRFKDDVREVEEGYECGIGVEGFGDIKEGDELELYEVVRTARKLSI